MTRPSSIANFKSLSVGLPPPVCVSEAFQLPSQIRDRIKAERLRGFRPVRYKNQYLLGYHWWLFPNYVDGVFSKVYARMNVFGDLVVGKGERTRLVCIANGRLTLSASISDAVVSASDTRLLVCL